MVIKLKILIGCLLILCFFLCCKNIESKEFKLEQYKKSVSKINEISTQLEYDIFSLDSLKFRGKNLLIQKKEFHANWKNPDSIKKYQGECGYLEGKQIKEYYFKGVMFIVSEDISEINSINFIGNDHKIFHPQIELNKNTKLNEFSDFYKNSYRERSEYTRGENLYTKLRFRTRKEWDEYIHLLFKNGKLIQFTVWNPC